MSADFNNINKPNIKSQNIDIKVHMENITNNLNKLLDVIIDVLKEKHRPSILYKPILTKDDNMWIVYYDTEKNLKGKGKTVELAMRDFDKKWYEGEK